MAPVIDVHERESEPVPHEPTAPERVGALDGAHTLATVPDTEEEREDEPPAFVDLTVYECVEPRVRPVSEKARDDPS